MHIRDNEFVKEGQLLIEIDPRDYLTALERAQAAAASAKGQLDEANAQLAAAEAQAAAATADVASAEATTRNAQQDLARYRDLAPKGAASQQSLDSAAATADSSGAHKRWPPRPAPARPNRKLDLAQAHRGTAAADLLEAEAQVQQAMLNLSYTKITAPITGRVTRRTVELGDYLQPGQALFALVDPQVWVTANFKETQLDAHARRAARRVRVDALPGRVLHGPRRQLPDAARGPFQRSARRKRDGQLCQSRAARAGQNRVR